ncbi:MAG TPA: archaeosine synthase subunit alpha [Methanocorpusculum sp.]|nr:archaeosine synthase subunit alpha [Methanocorpusculum sp.]
MSIFDVRKHDFLARIGNLRITSEQVISTPAVCEMQTLFPTLSERGFTNLPQSAPQSDADAYFVAGTDPAAVHAKAPAADETGIYLFANWNNCLTDSRRFLETYETLFQKIRPDAARYAPASALPSNVAMLIYCGFDLFDYTAVDLASVQGKFCTPEGEFDADWMDKGLCCCDGCKVHDLKLHNRLALEREIATVRAWIERGQLRELIETRCRLHAPQVELLRRIDRSTVFDTALPVVRSSRFLADAGESIYRREITLFEERLVSRYVPPRSDVCVLLPCASRKPYSLSRSHQMFVRVVDGRAHEVIITSPLGIVPRELELVYPAGHYDVPVTGFWDAEEERVLVERVSAYLAKHHYDRIICHLDGGAKEVVMTAAANLGIPLEITCNDEHPLSQESLRALNAALDGCRKQKNDFIHGTLYWQFGEDVDTKGLMVKGRYPQVKVLLKKQQLFTTDPATGLIRPTHEGWERIKGYRVTISPGFVPQGDILAPGIAECDERIREGDEVFVVGENYAATGKAVMSASEMRASNRGVAVKVRKTRK